MAFYQAILLYLLAALLWLSLDWGVRFYRYDALNPSKHKLIIYRKAALFVTVVAWVNTIYYGWNL